MLRRPLELHVLQEVRHSRLTVALVSRADEICHVHRRLWFGLVGKEQHP